MTVWAIAAPGLGAGLLVRFGAGGSQAVRLGLAAGAALAASLCRWGLLAMMEGRTPHARAVSATVAVVVTITSLSLPAVAGITAVAAAALALALPGRRRRPGSRAAAAPPGRIDARRP